MKDGIKSLIKAPVDLSKPDSQILDQAQLTVNNRILKFDSSKLNFNVTADENITSYRN